MARQKRKSDEAYNERRRVKRLIERMKRENRSIANAYPEKLIKRLESLVAGTYARGGRSSKEAAEAVERLKKVAEPVRTRERQKREDARRAARISRRNAIFRQKLSKQKESRQRAFWRATQHIWEGKVSKAERYKEIIDYFGDARTRGGKRIREYYEGIGKEYEPGDLQMIYDFIRNENEKIIEQLEEAGEVPEQYKAAIALVVTYG